MTFRTLYVELFIYEILHDDRVNQRSRVVFGRLVSFLTYQYTDFKYWRTLIRGRHELPNFFEGDKDIINKCIVYSSDIVKQ